MDGSLSLFAAFWVGGLVGFLVMACLAAGRGEDRTCGRL